MPCSCYIVTLWLLLFVIWDAYNWLRWGDGVSDLRSDHLYIYTIIIIIIILSI